MPSDGFPRKRAGDGDAGESHTGRSDLCRLGLTIHGGAETDVLEPDHPPLLRVFDVGLIPFRIGGTSHGSLNHLFRCFTLRAHLGREQEEGRTEPCRRPAKHAMETRQVGSTPWIAWSRRRAERFAFHDSSVGVRATRGVPFFFESHHERGRPFDHDTRLRNNDCETMGRILSTSLWCILALQYGCAALLGNQEPEEAPPFDTRRVAWSLLIEWSPEVAPPSKRDRGSKVGKALVQFYDVVNDRRENADGQERTRKCAKAWVALARGAKASSEHRDAIQLAQGYLGIQCGAAYARKSLQVLKRLSKRRDSADFLYYSSRFWHAEALLELNKTSAALTQYRYVLGEIESPLYPLSLLRTAHCHWDAGEVEEARTNMQYVMDWIGTKSQPTWVRSLKRRVAEDLAGFTE